MYLHSIESNNDHLIIATFEPGQEPVLLGRINIIQRDDEQIVVFSPEWHATPLDVDMIEYIHIHMEQLTKELKEVL